MGKWKIENRGSRIAIFYLLSSIFYLLSSIFYPLSSARLSRHRYAAATCRAQSRRFNHMGPLLTGLATAYSAQHPYVTFDIQGGGSQLGQSLVESGRVDLGLVSWPPQNLPQNLRSIPITRDAVALIVHPENKIGVFL